MRARMFPSAMCVAALFCLTASAQTAERRATTTAPQEQTQLPAASSASPIDAVVNEIALLRKSVQAVSTRLREIGERMSLSDAKQSEPSGGSQNRIAQNLEILGRTEQRAEILRKQLLELIEKETQYRSRIVQLDEEARPDSVDRSISLVGTTRTPELRDARRRILDNERKGIESLLHQTTLSRQRLEEDVKQADALVQKLRQRLLPLIEREIDKLNTN